MRDTFNAVSGAADATQAGASLRVVSREEVITGTEFTEIRVRTEQSVGGDPQSEEIDASSVLRDLSWCEHILDAEHREWLRLMYHAEWFG